MSIAGIITCIAASSGSKSRRGGALVRSSATWLFLLRLADISGIVAR
jgi:hypothetical protein